MPIDTTAKLIRSRTGEISRGVTALATGELPPGLLREVGLRGAAKSVYFSTRYAGSPLAFLFGKRASVSISSSADVEIPTLFVFDAKNTTHVHQGRSGSRLRVDDGATFRVTASDHAHVGSGSVVWVGGTFEMGDSYVNGDARISCADRVTIGDSCAIAWGVEILDNNGGHTLVVDGTPRPEHAPIEIRDSVWLGHHVTVQQGVTIGEGAVVASHSLVTDDVPPGVLAAGIPASTVSEDVEWMN